MTTDSTAHTPTDGQAGDEPAAEPGGGMTRRAFVQWLGAGLLVTVAPLPAAAQPRRPRGGGGTGKIAARVHIGKDGTITVMTGKVEAGQGARTELAQAAAEELGVPADRVQLIMADTDRAPDDGVTAGSRSTPSTVPAVRQGAAAARDVLIQLAAARFAIDARGVRLADGKAIDPASGRQADYGELVGENSDVPFAAAVPPGVTVTAVKEWKVMGRPTPRAGRRDLVTGAHRYPSDIQRPGMLYGKALRPPAYGARLKSIDMEAAKAAKDALAVRDGAFVGVAAPTLRAAEQALDAISRTAAWEEAPALPSSAELYDHLRRHARGGVPANPFADELAKADKKLTATYHVAYVQHAPMEPRAAVAEWNDGKLTVWTGTQNPFGARGELMSAFGLGADKVRVIVPDFGGGFGGKHQPDAHIEAARLAKAAGRPVLVRWTRAEEFTWAYYRPAAVIDVQAGLDAQGTLTSWHFVNVNSGGAAVESPYRIAKSRSQYVPSASPMRQGSYRCLAATANNFARESAMDELAVAAGADPLDFRRAHLDNPRLKAVLKTVAEKFNWAARSGKKDPRLGVGLACGTEKGSVVAACAEVAIEGDRLTVRHVCEAFECGAIVNPTNLLSQVAGCILMGLGPALREEMQFEKGRVLNATFWKYGVPRFTDVPELDIHLLNQPDQTPVGAGETPIIAIAPAIANAVFHATGRRIRTMPIRLAAEGKGY
ncbi:MAG: Nicotinate dehydrogenase subunit B [Phycisphaerae bacterium]|nr:Nicotinate dehydrogenase subunit B [Phycisphaerae bacterium]